MIVVFGYVRVGIGQHFERADRIGNQAFLQVDPANRVVHFDEVRQLLLRGARVGEGEIEIAVCFGEHVGEVVEHERIVGIDGDGALVVAARPAFGKLPCAS